MIYEKSKRLSTYVKNTHKTLKNVFSWNYSSSNKINRKLEQETKLSYL